MCTELFIALFNLTDPTDKDHEGCEQTVRILAAVVGAMPEQSQVQERAARAGVRACLC